MVQDTAAEETFDEMEDILRVVLDKAYTLLRAAAPTALVTGLAHHRAGRGT